MAMRIGKLLGLAAVMALGIILAAPARPASAVSWLVSTIANGGGPTDMAFDAQGNWHVVLVRNEPVGPQERRKQTIRYLKGSGSTVQVNETVTTLTGGPLLTILPMAVDGSGRPHIVFYEYASGPMPATRYVRRARRSTSGSWSFMTIDSGGVGVSHTGAADIAFDANGNEHIVYSNGANPVLKYAFLDHNLPYPCQTTCFVTEVIQSQVNALYPAVGIAVHPDGTPAVMYGLQSGVFSSMKYARRVAGVWVTETAATQALIGYSYPHLAIGSDGRAFITFQTDQPVATGTDLRLAQRSPGGVWSAITIEDDWSYNQHDIAVDASDNAYIAYRHAGDTAINLAKLTHRCRSNCLSFDVIAANQTEVTLVSLALTQGGKPHIAWGDGSSHAPHPVKLARPLPQLNLP